MPQMPDWLLDHAAKSPHTIHGDYVIVHHDSDEGPEYPEVTAYHMPTGSTVGNVKYVPHSDYVEHDAPGAPEWPGINPPEGYQSPKGWTQIGGGSWRHHVGYKVWDVHVHPDHRRKGIASAMYQHAEKHLGKTFAGDFQTPDGHGLRANLKKSALAKMALVHNDPTKPVTLYRVQNKDGEGPYQYRINPMADTRLVSEDPRAGAIHVQTHPGLNEDFPSHESTEFFRAPYNKRFAFEKPEHAVQWFGQEALDQMKRHGFEVAPVRASRVWRSNSGTQVFYDPHHEAAPMSKSDPKFGGTDHPKFKEWFGESKAVHPDGKPMRMYHGTTSPEDFKSFNIGEPRSEEDEHGETNYEWGSGGDPSAYVGAHFAEKPHVADLFSKPIYGRYRKDHGRVYPVYLRALNPKQYDSEHEFQKDLYSVQSNHQAVEDYVNFHHEDTADDTFERYSSDPEFREQMNREVMEWLSHSDESSDALHFAADLASEHRQALREQGHDSIRYRNDVEGGGYSWAVFDPKQVKSAIGNSGWFNPKKNNIAKSEGAPKSDPQFGKSDGWLSLSKAEKEKHPRLLTPDEAPRYQFKFKLDKPDSLPHSYAPLVGTMEVHHKGQPVGVMSFDQGSDPGSWNSPVEAIHVGYMGVHPEHRNKGLGTVMLQRFRRWVNHHRPNTHFMQSEVTSQGIMRHLERTLGEPLYIADAIRRYRPQEAAKELPEVSPEDENQHIHTGNYFHAIHWIGRGNRPTVHPWADEGPMEKSLKEEVRERVLAKLGKLTKNLSRLPMPYARPHHYIHWPLGAIDWRKQKVKVMHRDGAGGQPTGAGWVQIQDGQVLSQDGHPVSARNPGAR